MSNLPKPITMSPEQLAAATARLSQDAAAPLLARGVITEVPRPSNLATSRRFMLPELPNLNRQRSSTERLNGNTPASKRPVPASKRPVPASKRPVPASKRPVPAAKRPESARQNSFASKRPSSSTSAQKPTGKDSSSTSHKQPAKRPSVLPGLSNHGSHLPDPQPHRTAPQAPRVPHHQPSPTSTHTSSHEPRRQNLQPPPFRATSQTPRRQSRLPPNTVARKAPRRAIVIDSPPLENRVHGVKRYAETDHDDRSTKVPRTTGEFTGRDLSLFQHLNALRGGQSANPAERSRPVIKYRRVSDGKVVSPPKPGSTTTTSNSIQGVKRRADTSAGHQPPKVRRLSGGKDSLDGVGGRSCTAQLEQRGETGRQAIRIRRARPIVLDDDDEDDIAAMLARRITPERPALRRPTVSPITPDDPKRVVAGPPSAGKPVSSRTRFSTKPAPKPKAAQREPKVVPKKAAPPRKEPQARASAKQSVVVAASAAPGAAKAARNPKLVVPRYQYTMPGDLRSVMAALGRDTWNEYLARMEQKCLGKISGEEFRGRSRALFALPDLALRGMVERKVEGVVQSTLGRVLRDDEERRQWAGDMAVQPSVES